MTVAPPHRIQGTRSTVGAVYMPPDLHAPGRCLFARVCVPRSVTMEELDHNFWYFAIVILLCVFSCFQQLDRPPRWAFSATLPFEAWFEHAPWWW